MLLIEQLHAQSFHILIWIISYSFIWVIISGTSLGPKVKTAYLLLFLFAKFQLDFIQPKGPNYNISFSILSLDTQTVWGCCSQIWMSISEIFAWQSFFLTDDLNKSAHSIFTNSVVFLWNFNIYLCSLNFNSLLNDLIELLAASLNSIADTWNEESQVEMTSFYVELRRHNPKLVTF